MKTKRFLQNTTTVVFVAASMALTGCSGAELINSRNVSSETSAELEFTPTIRNEEGKSTASFEQSSLVTVDGETQRFYPSTHLNVVLEKSTVEVTSLGTVVKTAEETISDTPYSEGTTFGKDIVKKFTFSDGQVATVSYGWRYEQAVIANVGTISAPHMEITAVSYADFGAETTGTSSKVTLIFKATCTGKNADTPRSENIELCPWYTQTMSKTPDIVGNPIWASELIWKDNGGLTARVTKTIPHSIEENEIFTYDRELKVIMGEKIKTSWYVLDTWNTYESQTPYAGETTTTTDGSWTMKQSEMLYKYIPHYRTPAGEFAPDFTLKVCNWDVVFSQEGKTFTFKVNVIINFSHKIVYEASRAELYPNDSYLGSDVAEFDYIDTITGTEVYHSTSYTDLLLHP